MDFMNRGYRNQNTNTSSPQTGSSGSSSSSSSNGSGKKLKGGKFGGLTKIGAMSFLIALVLIVAGTIFAMIFFDNKNPEASSVDKNKYQAVFLNGGQVYFGKVTDLNSKYTRLNDIFYLRVNQQVQPDQQSSNTSNDVSLVKLGCELHGPQDQMVINREQVIFWENIKDDGQVVKAINEYKKQYPNGEQCQQSNGNTGSTGNNTGTNETTNSNATTNNNTTGNTGTGENQTSNAGN